MALPSASETHFEVERLKAQVQSLRRRVTDLELALEAIKLDQARVLADSLPTVPFNAVPAPDEP